MASKVHLDFAVKAAWWFWPALWCLKVGMAVYPHNRWLIAGAWIGKHAARYRIGKSRTWRKLNTLTKGK